MSVYSGFATRQQESKYNNLLENLVIALKKRIIKFYNQDACDEHKFKLLIKKIYKKMFLLEKGKFMIPKYSTCFSDLIEVLHIDINYDSLSDASSMISHSFSLKKDQADTENDIFKSRAILQSKRSHLQLQHKLNPLESSALSLNKKFNTIALDAHQEAEKNRSSSLGPTPAHAHFNRSRGKIKLKELKELKDIKQLRGTLSMPRVQDFLPKKQEIQPAFFNHQRPVPREVKVFRRQKYSRNQVQVEQL